MPKLTALSLSIAILGAVWAWLALGPLAGWALVWAGFIAWGCFFHSGADTAALSRTISGNIYGIIVGWIALVIIANVPAVTGNVILTAVVVGVTVFFLVIVASIGALSVVPANVYGYASIVAYTLSAGALGELLTAGNANPLVLLIISMVLGAIFGFASAKLSGVLSKREPALA